MDVVYSRKRIKIPKFNNKKTKIAKKISKIAIIILIAIFTSTFIIKSIEPIFGKVCSAEAKSIATKISNEKATEIMKNYKYDDIITISRNNDNKITGIEINMITINEIISNIAQKIQDELNSIESKKIGIAVGSFTGNKILSGRGPKIYYRITSVGNVETDYKSEFKSAGINQTIHRIYLKVNCKVSILTPFNTIEEEIENQIILAESLIVGDIPQTYYNFDNIEDPKDTIEFTE